MAIGRLVRQDHVLLHMRNGDSIEVNEFLDESDIWRPLTFEFARRIARHQSDRTMLLRTTYVTSRGRERIVTEITWRHVDSITAREFDEHPDGPRT